MPVYYFYLGDISIDKSRVSKSHSIIILDFITLFRFTDVCFAKLALSVFAFTVISCLIDSLIII